MLSKVLENEEEIELVRLESRNIPLLMELNIFKRKKI